MPNFVEGLELIHPQAVSVVVDRPPIGPQGVRPVTVALAATAAAGDAQQWIEAFSYVEVVNRYKSGSLVDLAQRIFSPSAVNNGATRMLCYRVNAAVKATGTLFSSGPTAAIALVARQGGLIGNQVRFKVSYNATTDAYDVYIGGYDGTSTASRAGITRPMLSVKYTGANATATLQVTSAAIVLAAGSGEGGTFNFTDYTTVRAMADAIIGLGVYDVVVRSDGRLDPATLDIYAATNVTVGRTTLNGAINNSVTTITVAATATFPSTGTLLIGTEQITYTGKTSTTFTGCVRGANSTTPASAIDTAAVQQLASTLAYANFKANNQALVDWFNNSEPYIDATRTTGVRLLTMTAYTNLSGGTDGAAVVNADYQTALDALQVEDAQIVTVGSSTAAVHTMVDTHCALMSSTGYNKERLGIVGGVAGETAQNAIDRATAIGSYRTALVWPGFIDISPVTRREATYSPVYSAAMVAGIISGLAVGVPGTHKTVAIVRPEVVLTPATVDSLLLGSVLPIEQDLLEGGRITQSVTTYPITAESTINLLRREISALLAADALVSLVRGVLEEQTIGQPIDSLFIQRVRGYTTTALKRALTQKLITGSATNPAYRSVAVHVYGDLVRVSFGANVVSPTNYVVLEASLGSFSS